MVSFLTLPGRPSSHDTKVVAWGLLVGDPHKLRYFSGSERSLYY
jgi:hypothetical protein